MQAGFSFGTTAYMCFMFSVTTPMGIILGMVLFSMTGYDDTNPKALIMEGLLGSVSSGILIYMALVDLIAVDFFHNKLMNSNVYLKKVSFIALTLGSASMSVLALWAWTFSCVQIPFCKGKYKISKRMWLVVIIVYFLFKPLFIFGGLVLKFNKKIFKNTWFHLFISVPLIPSYYHNLKERKKKPTTTTTIILKNKK